MLAELKSRSFCSGYFSAARHGQCSLVLSKRFLTSQNVQVRSMTKLRRGSLVSGTVRSVTETQTMVDLDQGYMGVLPYQQLSRERRKLVEPFFKVGERLKAVVIDTNSDVAVLSTRALERTPGELFTQPQIVFETGEQRAERWRYNEAKLLAKVGRPVGIEITQVLHVGVTGVLPALPSFKLSIHVEDLTGAVGPDLHAHLAPGTIIQAMTTEHDDAHQRIKLSCALLEREPGQLLTDLEGYNSLVRIEPIACRWMAMRQKAWRRERHRKAQERSDKRKARHAEKMRMEREEEEVEWAVPRRPGGGRGAAGRGATGGRQGGLEGGEAAGGYAQQGRPARLFDDGWEG